jgi:hypothetical protein
MSDDKRKAGTNDAFPDVSSAEALRRQFLDRPLDATRQPALDTALELARFMACLPDAFLGSERRELQRLTKTASRDDPRVVARNASIAQVDALRATAKHAQMRAERISRSVGESEHVLHGFVSEDDLTPRAGLTVRLSAADASAKTQRTAQTDPDGYFRIDIGGKRPSAPVPSAPGQPRQTIVTHPETSLEGHVEIYAGSKLIHRDPAAVLLNEGSIYREYFVSDSNPQARPDLCKFVRPGVGTAATAPPIKSDERRG